MVYQGPLQVFLNELFAAEKAVSAYIDMLERIPAHGEPPLPDELPDARALALKRNRNILDGAGASNTMKSYTALFNGYDSAEWYAYPFTLDEKFMLCIDILLPAVDFWFRIVFYLDAPHCETLRQGSETAHRAQHTAHRLLQQYNRCDGCCDIHFTVPWCTRLADDDTCDAAIVCLEDLESTIQCTTVRAEKNIYWAKTCGRGSGGNHWRATRYLRKAFGGLLCITIRGVEHEL